MARERKEASTMRKAVTRNATRIAFEVAGLLAALAVFMLIVSLAGPVLRWADDQIMPPPPALHGAKH